MPKVSLPTLMTLVGICCHLEANNVHPFEHPDKKLRLKFRYSRKATKFEKNNNSKKNVAFSEYLQELYK